MHHTSIRSIRRVTSVIAVLAIVVLTFSPTFAIVIRHDKSDADSLKLAERFGAVCRVLPDGSCTLIAENWVLTAAHVGWSMREGTEIEIGEGTFKVKRVILHPDGYGPPGLPPEVDLALVELSEPVKGIPPIPFYRGTSELGETLYIVGYGDFGDAHSELTLADGKRRAVTNKVDDAGSRRIFMKFDEPPGGTVFEGVGGPGDSGGPALIEVDDKVYVAGVSSGSMNGEDGKYGVVDVFTRVGSYVKWIEESMTTPPDDVDAADGAVALFASGRDLRSRRFIQMLFPYDGIQDLAN